MATLEQHKRNLWLKHQILEANWLDPKFDLTPEAYSIRQATMIKEFSDEVGMAQVIHDLTEAE